MRQAARRFRRFQHSIRSQCGAAAVEFAVVVPMLVMLLTGIGSAGFAYNEKLDLSHAAREGARYGAVASPSQAWATGSWAENIRKVVVERSGAGLEASQVCVSLVQNSSASTTTTYTQVGKAASWYTTRADGQPCANETYALWTVADHGQRVQVVVTKPSRINLGIFPALTFNITANAVARTEMAP
ncbi:MAG: pilus assembly protein [Acidimicrobiia bacterium]|nr:pilus assembly protein [Acidimicrobiia bacterium]